MGRLRDEDVSGLGRLLHPRRDVGRVPYRGVVHAQVVADAADHHQARVEPLPHQEGDALGAAKLLRKCRQRLRDPERRLHPAPRVILVGDRGTEQRHDAVAQELVDRSFVTVDLGKNQVKDTRHQPWRSRVRRSLVTDPETSATNVTILRSRLGARLALMISRHVLGCRLWVAAFAASARGQHGTHSHRTSAWEHSAARGRSTESDVPHIPRKFQAARFSCSQGDAHPVILMEAIGLLPGMGEPSCRCPPE